MDEITARREATSRSAKRPAARPSRTRPAIQPGGWSTRPAGAAGCMAAPSSPTSTANFLINTGEATAADLEGLGEGARRGAAKFGVFWSGRSGGSGGQYRLK